MVFLVVLGGEIMIPGPSYGGAAAPLPLPPSLVKASPAGSFRYANRFLSLSLLFLLQLLRDGLQILLPCYVLMRRFPVQVVLRIYPVEETESLYG